MRPNMTQVYKHSRTGNLSEFRQSSQNTQRAWSDKDLDRMAQFRQLGKQYREIGDIYGIDYRLVYSLLKRYRPLSLYLEIPKGYVTIKEFARKTKVGIHTVRWYIQEGKLKAEKINNKWYVDSTNGLPERKCITAAHVDEIYELINLGVPKTKIAKKLGFHVGTINRIVREYNLKDN